MPDAPEGFNPSKNIPEQAETPRIDQHKLLIQRLNGLGNIIEARNNAEYHDNHTGSYVHIKNDVEVLVAGAESMAGYPDKGKTDARALPKRYQAEALVEVAKGEFANGLDPSETLEEAKRTIKGRHRFSDYSLTKVSETEAECGLLADAENTASQIGLKGFKDPALLDVAVKHLQKGDEIKAVQVAQKHQFGGKTRDRFYRELTKSFSEKGDVVNAKESVKSIKENEMKGEALMYVAQAELRNGLPQDAEQTVQRISRQDVKAKALALLAFTDGNGSVNTESPYWQQMLYTIDRISNGRDRFSTYAEIAVMLNMPSLLKSAKHIAVESSNPVRSDTLRQIATEVVGELPMDAVKNLIDSIDLPGDKLTALVEAGIIQVESGADANSIIGEIEHILDSGLTQEEIYFSERTLGRLAELYGLTGQEAKTRDLVNKVRIKDSQQIQHLYEDSNKALARRGGKVVFASKTLLMQSESEKVGLLQEVQADDQAVMSMGTYVGEDEFTELLKCLPESSQNRVRQLYQKGKEIVRTLVDI